MPAEALIDIARAELSDLVGSRGVPVVTRVRQWPRGLPQYGLGHGRLTDVLTGLEHRRPGLFVTGNYLSGISVAACLTQAVETAALIHAFLDRRGRKAGVVRPVKDATGAAGIELVRGR